MSLASHASVVLGLIAGLAIPATVSGQQVAHRSGAFGPGEELVRRIETLRVQDRRMWNTFPSLYPVRGGTVTSEYGPERTHPVDGRERPHYGMDLRAPVGTPIRAAAEGKVVSATRTPDYGLVVDIDHGNGFITRYAHASRLLVRAGDIVRRGQTIALSGRTGRVSGPHLHYEVFRDGWSIDPCIHMLYPDIGADPAPPACLQIDR